MASKSDVNLSEFYELSANSKRKPCAVNLAAVQLDETEQEQLKAALETDKGLITASAVEAWLRARGHKASISAISNHRNGRCICHA